MPRHSGLLVATGVLACLATTPAAQSGSTSWDAKFRELPQASNMRASMERLSARPHHVGSPYDKDNAEWILARFKEWGWDAQIEIFSVLFPTPKERAPRAGRADALHGEAGRAGGAGRSDVGSEGRTAADLQRLFHRRRRHRPARLRQLRPARGLRASSSAAASPSRAPSSSRATANRGAASSRRSPPSTARSAASSTPIRKTTAYGAGDVFPERADAAARRRAARQRDGHADVSRRSADAGRRRDGGREAARHQGRADADEDSGAADLLRAMRSRCSRR